MHSVSVRPRAGAIAGLLALALVARIAAALMLGDGFLFPDETAYLDAADRLVNGGGFEGGYERVPAYPVFLAGIRPLRPHGVRGVRVAQAVVAATGCILVVALGAALFGAAPAMVAGLLYTVDPLLVVAAGLLYPEAIAAVLLVGTVLLAVHAARRDRVSASAAAGVGLGVLAQLRPVALLVVPVICIWIAMVGASAPRRRLQLAGAVLTACALALAPWVWRNYLVHGTLAPIATAGIETAPVERATLRSHGLVASMARQAWEHPIPLAHHIGREFLHFWELYPHRLTTDNPERRAKLHAEDPRLPLAPSFPRSVRDTVSAASFGLELALALVGFVAGWRARRRDTSLLAAVILSYALGHALFIGKLRYRITILPLLFCLVGQGAVVLIRWAGRSVGRGTESATASSSSTRG